MAVSKLSSIFINDVGLYSQEPYENLDRSAIVHQVALRALKELAVGLISIAICSQFVSGGCSLIALMVAISIISITINSIIHFVSVHYVSIRKVNKDEPIFSCLSMLRSLCFYIGNLSNLFILVHEAGHFFCAKELFQGKPFIKLMPFLGGLTQYWVKNLTPLGIRFGYQSSVFLVTLAGPLLAISVATVLLTLGLLLYHHHYQMSLDMSCAGLMVFFEHAQYALSALWSSETDLSHDFVCLKTFGIHPLFATAVIVAIPTILCLAFLFKEYLYSEKVLAFQTKRIIFQKTDLA